MISRADYEREVAAIIAIMQRTGTPDDIVEKVTVILNTLRMRLWPEVRVQ